MKESAVLKTGIAGVIIAAICCFTPLLVIVLGAVGLSAWLGWVDYVLLPLLILFAGMTAYGVWRRRRAGACCARETRSETGRV